ncbi:MAG: rhodanese [Desulfobulbus propionicus]|nr:MAG: rhodanese [Desulfobulbus propionicus]
MSIDTFTADDLYFSLLDREEIAVLDVRNNTDFSRFKVEAPFPFAMANISYFVFMEEEKESVAQVRQFAGDRPVHIVCAKEGSAKYVAEILDKYGFNEVRYLEGGIKSWGNLLVPVLLNPGENFQLYQFIRPGKASCSYGLLAKDELMLFDVTRRISLYTDFAQKRGARISRLFETHLQADYISGSQALAEETGAELLANKSDFADAQFTYTELEDGCNYALPYGPTVTALFTPGHTPGSTCYLIDNRFLLSGDTVFLQSVGRPDLGGQVAAWSDMLFATLQEIKAMDSALLILPGHYRGWDEAQQFGESLAFADTLENVLAHNRAIYATKTAEQFFEFIEANMRKQPEEYATIRLINAGLHAVDADKAEELDLGKNECAASMYAAQQEAKNG